MKNFILTLFSLLVLQSGYSQIINPTEQAKRKTEQRANQGSDRAIDRGLDKVEDGINSIFKKKNKKEKKSKTVIGKPPETGNQSKGSSTASGTTKTDNQGNTDYSAYKNFDFIPGENILFYDDFADGSLSRWGAYDKASDLSIVNRVGINWLEVKSGNFFPMNLKALPKSFTLEFDVLSLPESSGGTLSIMMFDESQANRLGDPWYDNVSYFTLSPISQMPNTGLGQYGKKVDSGYLSPQNEYSFYSWQPALGNNYARISLSVNNGRASLWVNKEKVADNIDLLALNKNYYLTFQLQTYFISETRMYLTNFRLATGAPQPAKEIRENKAFITQNIHFDVNSDVIKASSYQILREIAQSLKQVSGTILIVGHTDNDGSAQHNLELSQKRAASVKRALVNEFGIDTNRLITDGKGLTQPLNNNRNATEKAQNRRVEFILQ